MALVGAVDMAKKLMSKSLQDMVKGIRNSKKDLAGYIGACIQEIKEELRSRDIGLKAQALQKLTYVRAPPPEQTPPRARPRACARTRVGATESTGTAVRAARRRRDRRRRAPARSRSGRAPNRRGSWPSAAALAPRAPRV